ncbi:MAG: PDZ domain-containing protein, partial [Candidatus Methylomirabilales bacterium]
GRGGALITHVTPEGPAAKAGIRAGDVIMRVGDTSIHDPQDVHRLITDTPVGTRLDLHIIRDGHRQRMSVEVAELPA